MKRIAFLPAAFLLAASINIAPAAHAQSGPPAMAASQAADQSYPTYPGGEGAMNRFINKNLQYPKAALSQHISGTVFLQFYVEKNGAITDAKVIGKPHQYLDDEALRVLRLMPHWLPATKDGNPTRMQFNMPMRFDEATARPAHNAGSNATLTRDEIEMTHLTRDSVFHEMGGPDSVSITTVSGRHLTGRTSTLLLADNAGLFEPPRQATPGAVPPPKKDREPAFDGGNAKLQEYLATHVQYPDAARQENITGTISIAFTVQGDGTIADPTILNMSAHKYLDDEAIRVIKAMPRWIPGVRNGHLSSIVVNLAIPFPYTAGK